MKRSTAAFLVALALLAAAPAARAQDGATPERPGDRTIPADKLSFTVAGVASVPADQVDVELVVEAQGEDGATAEEKHRAKLKKVQAALERLKAKFEGKALPPEKPVKKRGAKKTSDDEDDDDRPARKRAASDDDDDDTGPKDDLPDPPTFTVEVREGRSSIGVARAQNPDGSAGDGSVTMATAVFIKMKGIAEVSRPKLRWRLAKILDVALDAGADSGANGIGARPAFRFRAKDNEELRCTAQADALKKGRARARRLAELAGRELGPLSAIAESGWLLRAGSTDQIGFDSVIGRIGNNKLNNYEMTTSSTEIELECDLTLEFELGKPIDPPAAKAPDKKK